MASAKADGRISGASPSTLCSQRARRIVDGRATNQRRRAPARNKRVAQS
jgi:hypothetical protein